MATGKRSMWLTLVAMTLANSMILVDQTAVPLATPDVVNGLGAPIDLAPWLLTANILPLAAFMVFGGRLGDLLGLRRVFLTGAVVFLVSTALAGAAQDIAWMIAARGTQGIGAALMMPTALAIVSTVFPDQRRGSALGILAGASAFFAALGPVLGGLLTSVDWRLVFLINVPLAVLTIVLTLRATPALAPSGARRPMDYPGVISFAIGIAAVVFGLSQGEPQGWLSADTVIPLAIGLVTLVLFGVIETRVKVPLLDFRLFRHLNFLAANISQVLAGMIELGLGFLLPFYLLLVIGVAPEVAGLALIPGTIPIILAGPLAGKVFDRVGGRIPLVTGFLVLSLSGVALAIGAADATILALVPGLLLQGLGLGIVLTVNDPTGLTAVPDRDQGQAAGMINTAEQLGGALGIAALSALELGYYFNNLFDRLAAQGSGHPTAAQFDKVRDFILEAEQRGFNNVKESHVVQFAHDDLIHAHIDAFQLTFVSTAAIALLGAVVCFLLVRRTSRVSEGPVFGRRSRWVYANPGGAPAVTRHPPPDEPDRPPEDVNDPPAPDTT
ncbi:MAG: DHA2 family efflux MFS transporter permease subunit [Solirubrobacterales bacterium]|nr:DHA2 family efflux MFS transporter permease subunit [Solirubrobacterales bacterium]